MSDLISRAQAIDALRAMQTYKLFAGDDMILIDQAGAMTELMLLPPAQPEPIKINIEDFNKEDWERLKKEWRNTPITVLSAQPKRGKWIKTARWGRVYYCDQCRNYLDFDGVNAGRGSTNFCPNCGADMRGEQDG